MNFSDATEKPIISLNNFSLSLDEKEMLKDISLEIFPKEIVLLYGSRNSGKSCFLRSFVHLNEELHKKVNGLGDILYQGEDVRNIDKTYIRSQIAYVDPSFVENMGFLTLQELFNLSLGIKIKEMNKEHYKIIDILNLSHIFSDLDNMKKYSDLKNWTIGEKISLLTFIAFSRRPKVFLFDSIFDHLDDFLLKEVKEILFSLKENKAFIISTRNLKLFSDISQKVIYLKNGQVKFFGKIEDFMSKTN
jgi:ABC-type multidrug transport system ATPase subunit